MSKLPWVVPGFRRPKFIFYRIKFTIPTSIDSRIIFFLVYVSIFYIYIGGVYNLLEDPIAIASDAQNNPVLVAEGLDRQFIIEGVVAGMLMFAGFFGFLLLKEATADPYNTNRANSYLLGGFVLIFFAFLALSNMYGEKLGN